MLIKQVSRCERSSFKASLSRDKSLDLKYTSLYNFDLKLLEFVKRELNHS